MQAVPVMTPGVKTYTRTYAHMPPASPDTSFGIRNPTTDAHSYKHHDRRYAIRDLFAAATAPQPTTYKALEHQRNRSESKASYRRVK